MLRKIEALNEGEQALLEIADRLPVDNERQRAINLLREQGLPGRKVEDWHYTDLRARLEAFQAQPDPGSTLKPPSRWAGMGTQLNAARLPFLDGRFIESQADELPHGVTRSANDKRAFRDGNDAVALINALTATPGIALQITENTNISRPVSLAHGTTRPGLSALRHRVDIGAGARAIFFEVYESEDQLTAAINTVVDLHLAEGSSAWWVAIQEEGDDITHLSQLNVTLAKNTDLNILLLNAGGKLVRREIDVVSRGEESSLDIRGANLIGGDCHLDVTTRLVHEAPNTRSSETFRNVATSRGNGVFQGQISVKQAAQKTDARMACNTLLLSDDAGFSAKPELEIFADDVQCAHGATVTDILDDHLFYMRARGIAERDARAILVKAFVEEVFDEIDNESLRDSLNQRIEEWLDRHG